MNISHQGPQTLKDAKTIHAWIHAASADYVTPEDWQNWADQLIAKSDMPPIWILELSASKSAADLTTRLQQILQENSLPFERSDSSIIGFLVLSYERENLSLRALLQRAAKLAEGGEMSGDGALFRKLLNRLESGEDKKALEAQCKEATDSFRAKAFAEWNEIRKLAEP